MNQTGHPGISVIVPLHNLVSYLPATIASLQQQTFTDVEFILIDDGSTDATFQLAKSLIGADPRFCLVQQPNLGPSAARNHGLRLARGQYLCFVDGDDLLPSDALEAMHGAAVRHAADLVTGRTLRFSHRKAWDFYHHPQILAPGLKTLRTHPGLIYAIGPCAKLFHRQLVEDLFFPEHIHLGEDQPFVLHAYSHAKTIYTVNSVVYLYRQREHDQQSLTQRAFSDPADHLNTLYTMVDLVRPVLPDRLDFDRYLQRFMACDLTPRLVAALRSHDPQTQIDTLGSLTNWFSSVDRRTFNRVPAFYYYPLVGLLRRIRDLCPEATTARKQLVTALLAKMTPLSYLRFLGEGIATVWDFFTSRLPTHPAWPVPSFEWPTLIRR